MAPSQHDTPPDEVARQAHAWVRRLASGQATVADAQALRRWCEADPAHAAAFARARKLWRDFDPAGREVLQRGRVPTMARRRINRRAFLGGALTATAAVATVAALHPPLGLWAPASQWGADFRTATGEQKRVRVSDDVWLALNTQTRVALQSGTQPGIRLLAGEAEVERRAVAGLPLSVIAGDGRTLARGQARFDVRNDDGEVCVTCLAGEVEVEQGARRQVLHRNERVIYDANGLRAPLAVDPSTVSAWREGAVVFRRTPLSDAVAEINRYRPGRVVLLDRELGRNVVSGRFRIGDMDQVIAQIRAAFGVRVRHLPGNVVLLG